MLPAIGLRSQGGGEEGHWKRCCMMPLAAALQAALFLEPWRYACSGILYLIINCLRRWIAAQVDACGLSTDPSVAQRYRKEAEVAHFEHPNIVHSLGLVKASGVILSSAGEGCRPVDDVAGLLTEYCSAGSLSGMLK